MNLPTGLPGPSGAAGPRGRRRRAGTGRPGGGGPNRPRIVYLIAAGVVLAALIAGAITVLVNRQPGQSVGQSVTTTVSTVLDGGKPENILIIGNNARDASTPTAPGQADLMVVAHFDPAHHSVTFLSVPRDALFAYPKDHDPIPKIKSALLIGGAALEARDVSRLLGMPISGYVEADFAGFGQAIDAVGGVWVTIPARLYDPTHSHANFEPGYQKLDGAQALAYIRIRQNLAGNGYRVNDFQRMGASYQVLAALKHQVLSRSSPAILSKLVGVLQRDFATDLSTTQILGLLAAADHARFTHVTIGSLKDAMTIASTPIAGLNLDGKLEGADYDVLTPQEIAAEVKAYGGKHPQTGLAAFPSPPAVPVSVTLSGEGQTLAASLRQAGFPVTLGGPPATTNGQVIVSYPAGQLTDALAVGRALGLTDEVIQPGVASGIIVRVP